MARPRGSEARRIAGLVVVAAALFSSCTTYVRPVKCDGGPYRCNGEPNVRFCEYEAVAVEGADCAELGLAASKSFCVITHAACVDTHYAVKDRNCRVVQYRALREWRECSAGTPTFMAP